MKRWPAVAMYLCFQGAEGYEIKTHQSLSATALDRSVLVIQSKQHKIGLLRAVGDERQQFPDSKSFPSTVADLVRRGAAYEDDGFPQFRSTKHFFNPSNSQGLTLLEAPYLGLLGPLAPAVVEMFSVAFPASPDWMLGNVADNAYTWRTLSGHLWDAYTAPLPAARKKATGLAFDTIGRLIHHIQDMAQPQHVRNDAHLHLSNFEEYCRDPHNPVESAQCQIYKPFRSPSTYELWTADLDLEHLPMAGYAPVFGPGDYSTFSAIRRFWAHEGKGLAEYTHRNFLSAGTMHQSPPAVTSTFWKYVRDLCAGAIPECVVADPNHIVVFYSSSMDDRFRPSASGTIDYAAADSLYSHDFRTLVSPQPVFTVNRFTFRDAHKHLLPRAVGYSTGLIDFIFRGDMEIYPPAEGVYAIVDASAAGCGNPCGYRQLKLKLQNTTPGGEGMGPGKLHAIVKFHRNKCHKTDLSGHPGAPGFPGETCRLEEEIAVSTVQNLSGVISRESGGTPYTFEFPITPIPLGATDVRLQLVFRGKLGRESDAVAVSTLDIAEPTFLAVGNNTDYAFDAKLNRYVTAAAAGQSAFPVRGIRMGFAEPGVDPVATLPLLNPGEHAQFAVLADKSNVRAWIRTDNNYAWEEDVDPGIEQFFLDESRSTDRYHLICPVWEQRGVYRQWSRHYTQLIQSHIVSAARAGGKARMTGKSQVACEVRPPDGSGGMLDFSPMTPKFGSTNARPWTISFAQSSPL